MTGCLKRMIMLVLLLLLIAGLWLFRDDVRAKWNDLRGVTEEPVGPSPELAARAEEKLNTVRDGSQRQVSLSATELESLLLYSYRGVIPAFLDSPTIELDDDQLRLRARVPVENLPDIRGIGEAAAFLPDTTELTVTGRLLPLDAGRVAFAVDNVSAARFPLPEGLVPRALARLGRRDEPGLPADAMALPLPAGIGAAYIRRDSLVLVARTANPPQD